MSQRINSWTNVAIRSMFLCCSVSHFHGVLIVEEVDTLDRGCASEVLGHGLVKHVKDVGRLKPSDVSL
jgi:hypothetical protein